MKKSNKVLLIKYAAIGLQHAPKNTSKEELEKVKTLLQWVEGGATGNWPTVSGKTRDEEEGFVVNPPKAKARVRKAAKPKADPIAATGVDV